MSSEISPAKIHFFSENLARARKKNFLTDALPAYISKDLNIVKKIRNFAEAKLEWHPIGFKIGGTNPKIMSILKGKEPFYSYLFKEQTKEFRYYSRWTWNLLFLSSCQLSC